MRHPLLRIAHRQRNAGRLDGPQHLCAEDLGQRFLVEQVGAVLAAPLASPAPPFCIDRGGGNDEMDMRVEVEAARVRVQHRDGSRCSLQLPVALAETCLLYTSRCV